MVKHYNGDQCTVLSPFRSDQQVYEVALDDSLRIL
jgi:hypothetical protein